MILSETKPQYHYSATRLDTAEKKIMRDYIIKLLNNKLLRRSTLEGSSLETGLFFISWALQHRGSSLAFNSLSAAAVGVRVTSFEARADTPRPVVSHSSGMSCVRWRVFFFLHTQSVMRWTLFLRQPSHECDAPSMWEQSPFPVAAVSHCTLLKLFSDLPQTDLPEGMALFPFPNMLASWLSSKKSTP